MLLHDYSVPLPLRSYFIYAFCTWIGEAEHHVQLRLQFEEQPKLSGAIKSHRQLVMSAQWEMIPVRHKTHHSCVIEKALALQNKIEVEFSFSQLAKCVLHYAHTATITRFCKCLLHSPSQSHISLWLNQRFLLRLINWDAESSSSCGLQWCWHTRQNTNKGSLLTKLAQCPVSHLKQQHGKCQSCSAVKWPLLPSI